MSGRDVIVIIVVALGILIMSFAGVLFVPWLGWRTVRYMPMMGYGMMFGMFAVPVLLLVLLGAGVYYAVKGASRGGRQESGRVLEIIKERYAKGEISKEQYVQLKKDLE